MSYVKLSFLHSLLFLIGTILSCSKENEPDPKVLVSLVNTIAEPAGTNCKAGGFKVETGVDKNSNAILDADEVDNSFFVCTGTALILVTLEEAGTNCEKGGHRIDSGTDANKSGSLDATEITNTFYICNDEPANFGKQTIMLTGDVTDEEAAQAIAADFGPATQEINVINCTKLTTVDLSMLETAIEINISNNAVLKHIDLSGLKIFSGNFSLDNSPEVESLEFSSLSEIHLVDFFRIQDTKIEELKFPQLITIDGGPYSYQVGYDGFIIIDAGLKSLSFPELTSVGGGFYLAGEDLISISAPKLVQCDWFFNIYAPAIEEIAFNVLVNAKVLDLQCQQLTSLSLPELNKCAFYASNGKFTTLDFPKLSEGHLGVAYADNLETISAPLMVTGGFQLEDNPKLATLSMPLLTSGSIILKRNPTFVTLSLPEFSTSSSVDIVSSNLISLNLPKLKTITYLSISDNPVLTSISFAENTELAEVYMNGNPNLNSFSRPITIGESTIRKNLYFNDNKFPSALVNGLLADFAANPTPLVGYAIYLNQTVAAPPSGQGLADLATLRLNNYIAVD